MNQEKIEEIKRALKTRVSKGSLPTLENLGYAPEEEGEGLDFVKNWYRKIYDFDFLDDADFEEIIFHGPERVQINRGRGREFDVSDLTVDDFQLALEVMCLRRSIEWNYANPFASFDVCLGGIKLRATLLHHSLTGTKQSKLFLRKHSPVAHPLESFSQEAPFLREAIVQRKNILISGGTGSGKTSLINALLSHSDPADHLVALEDALEILSPSENCTRMLARQGKKEDLKLFMSHAMRLSPDRIVVGELRSAEAESFLLAMNSGHRGLISSIHANGAVDAISRVALLVRFYAENPLDYTLVTDLVCKNIDFVVHIENKKVKEIIEVFGSEAGQVFYEKKAA